MKFKQIISALCAIFMLWNTVYAAQPLGIGKYNRQMEALQRGIIARDAEDVGVFISWRNLASENVKYNLYKNGQKLNVSALDVTNYTDETGTFEDTYFVTAVSENGEEQARSEGVKAFEDYLSIPINRPQPQENAKGEIAEYKATKAGVGDLDGDGEYEIVVVWYPDNAKDNSQSGYTSVVYIDAYKLNGQQLWRINMGQNIRAGEHYVPTIVYDFDGDGMSEIALRTADGTIDGKGNSIGDKSKKWVNAQGYILNGPEYLTIFDGKTGEAIDTVNFSPERGNVADWGDTGGNRVDRFLGAVAYLDGEKPSLIMSRGYYTNREGNIGKTEITAYDFKDGKISIKWEFKANLQNGINPDYVGQGNHSIVTADVDDDGFDEIIYGSMVVDHDGTGLYSTKRGHGDAIHVGFFRNEDRLQLVKANESIETVTSGYGFEYRYADKDEIIFAVPGTKDNGRTVVADIDPNAEGPFIYGAGGTGMWINKTGDEWEQINPGGVATSFPIWWTGDLLRELGEGIYSGSRPGYKVVKYDWNTNVFNQLFYIEDVVCDRRPLFQGDIIGDWREELLLAENDGSRIRLYTTNIPTEYNLTTLMHDPKYRLDVATQPSGYSQPPWPGYYIGHNDFEIPQKGEFVYNQIPQPNITDDYTISESKFYMTLNIGSNQAMINGQEIKIDENAEVVPFIENDRTLVPLRFVCESLKYEVEYNDDEKSITLVNGSFRIELKINSEKYKINGDEYEFDNKVQVFNDRTFVPIRALSEIIGMSVDYDDGLITIFN